MHFCHKSAPLLLPELKIFTNVTEVVDLLDSIGHSWTTLVVIGRKWRLSQCLFGENLPHDKVNANVVLVETEKTAVICSLLLPEYIWLATGGKSQFNDRLMVLKGRKVTAFPDIDGYDEWRKKAKNHTMLDITISDILGRNATPDQRERQVDIADVLLEERLEERQLK